MASGGGGGGGGSSLSSPIPFPDPITVFINGVTVPVIGKRATIIECMSSSYFHKWIESIDPEITVTRIVIHSFDPHAGIKLKADATFNGKPIPGIVFINKHRPPTGIFFIRGNSVTIFIVLWCNRMSWVVYTKKPAFAIGSSCCAEIPTGTIDEENNFVGVAAEKLEEAGIKITGDKLISLGDMHPNPGDEMISLFCYEEDVSPEQLASLVNFKEGEVIILEIKEYLDTINSNDAKVLSARLRYEYSDNTSGGGQALEPHCGMCA